MRDCEFCHKQSDSYVKITRGGSLVTEVMVCRHCGNLLTRLLMLADVKR